MHIRKIRSTGCDSVIVYSGFVRLDKQLRTSLKMLPADIDCLGDAANGGEDDMEGECDDRHIRVTIGRSTERGVAVVH
jgi:hypothetical protein